MSRRNDGNAQVDRLADDPDRTTPVLRKLSLGDVKLSHHLEPAAHRLLHRLRQRGQLAHDTVHADPRSHLALPGLEMNVRGAVANCLAENLVYEAHGRRSID